MTQAYSKLLAEIELPATVLTNSCWSQLMAIGFKQLAAPVDKMVRIGLPPGWNVTTTPRARGSINFREIFDSKLVSRVCISVRGRLDLRPIAIFCRFTVDYTRHDADDNQPDGPYLRVVVLDRETQNIRWRSDPIPVIGLDRLRTEEMEIGKLLEAARTVAEQQLSGDPNLKNWTNPLAYWGEDIPQKPPMD